MEGYTQLFLSAEQNFQHLNTADLENIFHSFRRNRTLFGFIDNGDIPVDQEAISIAKSLDENLYFFYLNQLKDRKMIGYEGSTNVYAAYNHLDSRHIMMNTILFHHLKENCEEIVEIGGGYGNWLFLNRNKPFHLWTIIDLPHIGKLQNWCLKQLDIDSSKYKILSCYDYKEAECKKFDLVIGSHSLSEFSFDIFKDYYQKIIIHSKYLFYSHHKFLPNKSLNDMKKNMILDNFTPICEIPSENGNVLNCLFKNASLS